MRRGTTILPVMVAVLMGCADPRATRVATDADEYISAIQYRDATDLIKHQAAFRTRLASLPVEDWGRAREEQIAAAEARLAAFDEAKVSGTLPMETDGIDLIQGLAIGKGIFYSMEPPELPPDGASATAVMVARPDYGEHRFAGLPAGTRVYLMAEPLGTLRTVVVGEGAGEQVVRVVSEVRLEWSFRWFDAVDVYPEGWAVESVRPLPGVAYAEIRRVF